MTPKQKIVPENMNEGIPVLMRKNVDTEGRLPLKNLSKSFLIKYYFQEYDCSFLAGK